MWSRWRFPRKVTFERAQVNAQCSGASGLPIDRRLRLLSFNVQVGIRTASYHHYLTRSWQHVLPTASRLQNLQRIGSLLAEYDLVALQEVDGGSLRSGQINQVEYLANLGAFPYWYQQLNRNLRPFAQHSNGLLSRVEPAAIEDHPLPGPAGRGAIILRFGDEENALVVVMMHLALGTKTRNKQLSYICEHLRDYQHVILMGDMNTSARDLLENSPLSSLPLLAPQAKATFPSWRPQKCLDHILISPSLILERFGVLDLPISDHLPVAIEVRLPESLSISSPPALV